MSPYGSRPDWEEDRPVWERTILTCVAQPLIIPVLTAVGAVTLVVWVVVWIHTKLVSLREARAQRREKAREAERVRANEAAKRGQKIAQSLADDEAAMRKALDVERDRRGEECARAYWIGRNRAGEPVARLRIDGKVVWGVGNATFATREAALAAASLVGLEWRGENGWSRPAAPPAPLEDADWIDVDTGCVQSSALRASFRGGVAPKPPKIKAMEPCHDCREDGRRFVHCPCAVTSPPR